MSGAHSFGPDRRLPDPAAFDAVFSRPDHRIRCGPLMLLARQRLDGPGRLGTVVAKRHLRSACVRNRVRRCAREEFRLREFTRTTDLIFMIRGRPNSLERGPLRALVCEAFDRLERKVQRAPDGET